MYRPYLNLKSARTFLEVDREGKPVDRRLRVCVATLLYDMAKRDGRVDRTEFLEIIRALVHEFKLMDDEATETLEIAAFLDRERSRFEEFVTEVNEKFDTGQREHLFSMLCRVAEADGRFDFAEQEFARHVRWKLKLSDPQSRV